MLVWLYEHPGLTVLTSPEENVFLSQPPQRGAEMDSVHSRHLLDDRLEEGRATTSSLLGLVDYESRANEERPPFYESFLLRMSRHNLLKSCIGTMFESSTATALTRIKEQRAHALEATQRGRRPLTSDRIYVVIDRMWGQLISMDRMLAELASGVIDGEDSVLVCDPSLPAVMRSVKSVLVGKNEKLVVLVAMQQYSDNGFMTLKGARRMPSSLRAASASASAQRVHGTCCAAPVRHLCARCTTLHHAAQRCCTLLGASHGRSALLPLPFRRGGASLPAGDPKRREGTPRLPQLRHRQRAELE